MRIDSRNLLLIIASVALSLLLWYMVGAEERAEIILSVPLEYRNLQKGYEILAGSDMLTVVNVWVRGTAATIKNLQPHQVSAWIDLSNAKPGDRIFELSSANVQVPYDFAVLRIAPTQVKLRIEEIVTRTIPVLPHFEGKPQEGMSVTSTVVTPPKVAIVGPRSAVESVKQAITDSIDLTGLNGESQHRVNVGVENTAVRLGDIKEVVVSLRVSEIEDILTLRHVPVTVTGSTHPARFNPKNIRVDLQAPKTMLKELSGIELQAVLDLQGLNPGSYELTPKISGLKDDKKITVSALIPERIHVQIE
jgi:YbbR domain-containing protein